MVKVENINNIEILNPKIENNVKVDAPAALIAKNNLPNIEQPKEKSFWIKFKKFCLIRVIIAIWNKVFGAPKKLNKEVELPRIEMVEVPKPENPEVEPLLGEKKITLQKFDSPKKINQEVKLPRIEMVDPKIPEIPLKIVEVPEPENPEVVLPLAEKKITLKKVEVEKPIEKAQEKVTPLINNVLNIPAKVEPVIAVPQPAKQNDDERIGKKLEEVKSSFPQLDYQNKDFQDNEVVLVIRSGPPAYYQYGKILGKKNNEYRIEVNSKQGHITKPANNIYKIKSVIKIENEPLIEFSQEELDLGAAKPGPRTVGMNLFLMWFPAYDRNSQKIKLNQKDYTPLTAAIQDISTKPVASCGSSERREIITLDPDHSPILNDHYEKLKNILQDSQKNLGRPLSEEAILKHVRDYIRKEIFPSDKDLDLTDSFIDRMRNDPRILKTLYIVGKGDHALVPIIPIDEFIKEGVGVCRHHALVASYLLDRLTKEPEASRMLDGVVQHMRDNVPAGNGKLSGHIWVTFLSKKEKKRWHIDTLWNEIWEFSTPQAIAHLKMRGYGEEAINNQVRKAAVVPL